jgi:hypothetical protein
MLNRIIPAVALVALVGATACERREETRIETPATEAPAVTPAPTVEPVPMTTDTPYGTDPAMTDPAMQPGAPAVPCDTL